MDYGLMWDGDQLLEELDGTGAQTAEYVYGPGIDEPLRMQRGTTKTYYLADGLGSVTHLTNPNGAIVEQYTYDPYGKPSIFDGVGTPLTASAFGNRFLFTGREYDQETGFYYNRARYWSPIIGRFMSRDPLGYFDGPNPYTYVRNNPVNFVDPYGTISVFQISVIVFAIILYLGIKKASEDFKKYKETADQLGEDLAKAGQDFDALTNAANKYPEFAKSYCQAAASGVQVGMVIPHTSLSGPVPTSKIEFNLNALQQLIFALLELLGH